MGDFKALKSISFSKRNQFCNQSIFQSVKNQEFKAFEPVHNRQKSLSILCPFSGSLLLSK